MEHTEVASCAVPSSYSFAEQRLSSFSSCIIPAPRIEPLVVYAIDSIPVGHILYSVVIESRFNPYIHDGERRICHNGPLSWAL